MHTKPNPNAAGIWIFVRPGPAEIAQQDGPKWVKVPGYDIAGQGDVHHIGQWSKKHSMDDLKNMVITKGWSGVTLGKAGTGAADNAWFKKVDWELTPDKTKLNPLVEAIWIYKK